MPWSPQSQNRRLLIQDGRQNEACFVREKLCFFPDEDGHEISLFTRAHGK